MRDEAKHVPTDYTAPSFKSQATQHTKPQLTWDDDDAGDAARARALSRRPATTDELRDDDFKAYLASSGSDSGEGSDEGIVRMVTEEADAAAGAEGGAGVEGGKQGAWRAKDAAAVRARCVCFQLLHPLCTMLPLNVHDTMWPACL